MFETKFISLNVYTIVALIFISLGVFYNNYPWWSVLLIVLIYLIILVLGVVKIQWNFFIKSTNSLPLLYYTISNSSIQLASRNKQIAITFDDGPSEYTVQVLDVLKKHRVPACFFVIGSKVSGREAILQQMIAEQHQIGNHSFEHGFNFDWKSSQEMLAEIEQTNEAILKVTEQPCVFFRPPYGVTNPNLAKAIKQSGMRSIGWSIRSLDTVAKDEAKLIARIVKKAHSGGVILLHDTSEITVKILPKLIEQLRQKGYEFVKIV